MSEGKKDSPHGTGTYGEPQQKDLLGGVSLPKHRRSKLGSIQQNPGIFDKEQVLPEALIQLENLPRVILFKKGTVLYAASYRNDRPVLPFNEVQADGMVEEILDFDQNLEIAERSMGQGRNGQEVIKPIGKSSYGAFVEVFFHKKDRDSKDLVEKRFVRLQDRALARDNQKLKFKKANQ